MSTPQGILALALPFSLALAAMAAAFGLGRAVSAAMEAIARQPEAAPQIRGAMIVGCGFIEALAIYALIVVTLFGIGIFKIH